MSSTYIPGFPNPSGTYTSTSSGLTTQQVNVLISQQLAPVTTSVSGLTSSITTNAITDNGTFSCGTNSATVGSLTSSSVHATGTMSCGTNAMTCGALSASSASVGSIPVCISPIKFIQTDGTQSVTALPNLASTQVGAFKVVAGDSVNNTSILIINAIVKVALSTVWGTPGSAIMAFGWGTVGTASAAPLTRTILGMTPSACNGAVNGTETGYTTAISAPGSFVFNTTGLAGLDLMLGWSTTAPTGTGGVGTITAEVLYAYF